MDMFKNAPLTPLGREEPVGLPDRAFRPHRSAEQDARGYRDPSGHPKSPIRDDSPRFRSMLVCATAFGGWEESFGKSQSTQSREDRVHEAS